MFWKKAKRIKELEETVDMQRFLLYQAHEMLEVAENDIKFLDAIIGLLKAGKNTNKRDKAEELEKSLEKEIGL